MTAPRRLAVVLMNLGGPDSLAAVRPFLFNLFSDPAIIELRQPLRWLVAQFISRKRAPFARRLYAKIGGASPLLANTRAQARALEAALAGPGEAKVFIAMRYWHPFTEEAVREVAAFDPDRVVLLPLYPQFSGTTTGSSMARWREAAREAGLAAPTRAICCFPDDPGFAAAAAALIDRGLAEAAAKGKPRLLLSAHGLPQRTVDRGDPYQSQVERSAAAILSALARRNPVWSGVDSVVCYQSRVGPLQWLGPYTDEEIRRAGRDRMSVVVFPIAFVSEHSETLVELDIDYRHLAIDHATVPAYVRVPTVGVDAAFIEGLARMVREAAAAPEGAASSVGTRLCPSGFSGCAMPGVGA